MIYLFLLLVFIFSVIIGIQKREIKELREDNEEIIFAYENLKDVSADTIMEIYEKCFSLQEERKTLLKYKDMFEALEKKTKKGAMKMDKIKLKCVKYESKFSKSILNVGETYEFSRKNKDVAAMIDHGYTADRRGGHWFIRFGDSAMALLKQVK